MSHLMTYINTYIHTYIYTSSTARYLSISFSVTWRINASNCFSGYQRITEWEKYRRIKYVTNKGILPYCLLKDLQQINYACKIKKYINEMYYATPIITED